MKKSKFSKRIRIDPEQLVWIRDNRKKLTMAGFLDRIINFYKKK